MISRALNALRDVFRYRSLSDGLTIERLTAERAAAIAERDVERERFKLAATDLAKQAEEIDGLRGDVAAAEKAADDFKRKAIAAEHEIAAYSNGAKILHDAIASLRHDANMWRNSLKRSRDRKKGVSRG